MSDSQKSHAQLIIENQQLRSELELLRSEYKALKHSDDNQPIKQVEEALQKSEKRFRMAFDRAPIGMACNDVRGRFLQVNPAFCRMLGYSEEEFLKLGVADITHPDDKETSLDCIQNLNDGQLDVLRLEKRYICKDGRIIWGAVNSSVVNDAQGSHLFHLAQIQDITERKQADNAFHAMMETTVGTTGQAFFDITVRSLCDLLGTECAIIGKIENGDHIRALAMQLDGKTVEGFEYDLPGTPCSNVAAKGYCAYPEGLCKQFPDDKILFEMKAEAYVGVPLRDQQGEAIGVLCVISRHKLSLPSKTQEIFEIIAVKAAAEIERKQAEEALTQSEKLYHSLVETMNEGLAMVDENGLFNYANGQFCKILGYPMSEIIGEHWMALYDEDAQRVIKEQLKKRAKGSSEPYELENTRKDGTKIWLSISPNPIYDEGGNINGSMGLVQDITELKQAEEELRKSEAIHRLTISNISDAVFITDSAGVFTYICQNVANIFGFSLKEVVANSYNIGGLLGSGIFDPDELERSGEISNVERIITDKAGKEHNLLVNVKHVSIGEGSILYTCRDITERKQAEDQLTSAKHKLELSLNLLQSIIEAVPIRVFWKDRDSKYLGANSLFARDAGLSSPEEVIGKTDFEMGWKDQAELYQSDDRLTIATGVPKLNYEEPQTTPEGEMIWLKTSKVPLCNDAQKVIGILGIYEEITERRQAAEALRESEEKFRALSEKSLVGIYLIQDGVFKYVNPCFAEISGYKVEEFNSTIKPKDIVHSEDWPIAQENIRKRISGEMSSINYNVRIIKKDGGVRDVEVYGSQTTYESKPAIIGTLLDVTERKQAEEGLLLYESTVSNFTNMLAVLDKEFIYMAANPAYLAAFNKSYDEIVGHTVSEVFGEGFFNEVIRPNAERCLGGEEVNYQAWFDFPAYEPRYMDIHYYPYTSKTGELIGIIVNARNITEQKQAEAALVESETRFRGVFESKMIGNIFWNGDGDITGANDAFLEMVGYTRDEVLSGAVRWADMTPPEFKEQDAKSQQEIADTGTMVPVEKEYFRKDGTRIPVLIGAASMPGAALNGVAFVIDITKHKQAEKDIRESEEKYRSLMQHAQDAIFIADGESGILIDANRSAEELIGLPRENIIGMHQSQLHPEAENYRKLFSDHVGSGDDVISESMEIYVQHSDGSKIPIEIRSGVIEVGGKKLIQGIFHDITRRKQAAESLRKSEKKYSTLIESSNDGIVIVQDMQFKFCNGAMADITGYSLDELQGMNYLTIIDAEFRNMVSERYIERLAGENPPDQYVLRFVCKDGTLKEIEASSIRRSRYEDKPAITVVYRDITEQKYAQEQVSCLLSDNRRLSRRLMQSQEDERRYIARELHDELGQSLTAIDTASRLISLRSKEEGVSEKADEISHITSKLFKDVRSMLVKLRPPMLDSVGLSASLQNLTSHWMRSNGTVCTFTISDSTDDFPDIVNIAIYRVLQECLTNISRHAMADQVEVTLNRVNQKGESGGAEEALQLDVRDNGEGMNLFITNAMGLGMVGIRERVSALGGKCFFNSTLGEGMHTSIIIPKFMGKVRSENMSGNIVCVQLVDDHAIVRSGFRHLLEEEGGFYVVVESDSAEQAWKDYLAHKPDIVIMDISMPGIGGLEGIKRILSRDPSARILALTMLGSELVTRVMQAGAKGYLSKSSASYMLVKAVRTIMQGRTFIDVEDGGRFLLDHVNGVSNPFHALSKREFEILMHLLAEKTVAEISDITCMNSKTVHSHKANILKKLKVSGMVGLTRLAMKFSIIKEE